ncbi:L-alanine-DL-glutamate epimerase-like enolase superfamily enzyme [Stella humosa]|uniref:L-alanine-DL-glutamate epimerase-like enolase superfamily enzyme n=1 Tax=Stella humosa TaxID=94 RepID=A0A3N1MAY5_9PROT|nr:mandelate racemase/muconate lactonizing enzyme family protein [Stella humosa]ROQ00215.1 L-alanine-DL-glutamate epimerase-like enolase superfamily enzyme [Stella humosa]BBK30550.1 enolase [Stella humosa]
MRIAAIEDLHADAGWRTYSFLKVTTDDGIVGWSEYSENYGSAGLTGVIRAIAAQLVGVDPRPVEKITAMLYAQTRQAPGGVNAQAIAAIENALLDVKAKGLGVRVCELFGGPVRERLPLYWSHCGTYRVTYPELCGVPPVTSLDDVKALGREVRAKGYGSLKTNILRFDGGAAALHMPGFARGGEGPEINVDRGLTRAVDRLLGAFREGAGEDAGLHLDLNFNFRTEGYIRMARAIEDHDPTWVEIDLFEPDALAHIRRQVRTPIASGESLFGRRGFLPYLAAGAMDVAIVDVVWNGLAESLKIAAMADAYEINVAPHNFYGHLSTAISAHFSAAVPNFRIMEIDVDDCRWRDEFYLNPPVIRDGHLHLPTGPGWGVEVNEAAVRARSGRR